MKPIDRRLVRFLAQSSEDYGEHILIPVGIAPRGAAPFQLYIRASRLLEWARERQ